MAVGVEVYAVHLRRGENLRAGYVGSGYLFHVLAIIIGNRIVMPALRTV